MLRTSSPSKHNVMLGTKIAHPKSTNYDDDDDFDRTPVKRFKPNPVVEGDIQTSPRKRRKLTEDHDELADTIEGDESRIADPQLPEKDHQTDLETALPPIRTDDEAIEEYEATRAGEAGDFESAEDRLKARKWTRGKTSIYVDAFNLALETVLADEAHLFNDAEIKVFEDWRSLPYEAQYLYVRLFLRKTSSWHRVNKLGYYSDIASIDTAIVDLQLPRELPICPEEMHAAPGDWDPPTDTNLEHLYTFADRSEDHITTLEEASSLLLLDELKAIAKDAKVQGKNKSELLRALRKTSGKQSGLGFLKRSDTEESMNSVESRETEADSGASTPQRGENRDAHFLSKIMADTGPCIRLSLPVLKLFERVHLVFYRSSEWTEKSLTTIILARISRWNFPEYLVSRSANIFASRSLLLEFEASARTQFRVDNVLEFNGTPTKDTLQTVLDIFEEVLPRWQVLLKDEQNKEDSIYSTGEGAYLRRLSPAWIYTRIVHKGAYVLGKFKHHLREHGVLTELLDQKLFHTSRRGDWYQRKALLEEHYMHALHPMDGRSDEAQKKHWKQISLRTCEAGLEDPLTHLIHHHDLQKRVMKLEKQLKIPKRSQHDFGHVRLAKPVERTFHGTQFIRSDVDARRSSNPAVTPPPHAAQAPPQPGPTRRGAKTIWLDPLEPASRVSVESMCLSHYRSQGWRGFHCESSLIRTLFAALFYDVLFTYVPNVFQTAYQTCPLDLHTDSFYPCRISEVNARLNAIGNGDAEAIVRAFYATHAERRTCVVGVKWDFEMDDVLRIVRAWDRAALGTVMKVLAQEYGARGGGVPDLFLWREFEPVSLRSYRVVERQHQHQQDGDDMTVIKNEDGVVVKSEERNQEAPTTRSNGAEAEVGQIGDVQLVAEESDVLDDNEKRRRRRILDAGQTGEVMFAEVKSENDRLSDTQRMWIDVLTGAGVKVELCLARADKVIVEDT